MAQIEVRNLWKSYGTKTILRDVNFIAESGDIILIRGPSGIGKTTFLNMLSGIDLPDKGEVIVDGVDITKMDENERAKLRLEKMGIIFQTSNLIDDLNVVENIALPLKLAGKKWRDRVNELLKYFGIERLKYSFPNSISGGEQQRVAIARAVANNPEILVADEPTSNLDDENTENIVRLIKRINEDMEVTVIIATHDPRISHLGKRSYFMEGGTLHEG